MLCVWGHGHLLLQLRCQGVSLLQDLLQVVVYVDGHPGVDSCKFQEDKPDVDERSDEEDFLLLSPWR